MISPKKENLLVFPGVKPGSQVIAEIAKQSDTVLLAFSAGKDAVATWLAIRPHFKRIIPYYMYLLPDLEFVEVSLRYYEQFFGTKILRVPHPSLYRMINNAIFQTPDRLKVIENAQLPEFDYDELRDAICDDQKVSQSTFTASGVRAADSLARRANFKTTGPINYSRSVFYPIWDWRKAALIDAFTEAGVSMAVDYQVFGRSFDGFDFRFIYPIRKHFPRDYERIREFFPMVEAEFKRYEYAQKHYDESEFAAAT